MSLNIEDFYHCPNVFHKDWNDLVLFSYTRECQYDRIWNPITLASRGIIFNKKTGKLVFRCMKKFFNLNEMEFTRVENLPNLPFTATKKMDGILGLLFQYEGQIYVATRGSFTSPYAYWATDWVRKSMNIENINPAYSYHFEIIYKEGRIVIDYGDKEHLVLICVLETETGRELSHSELVQEANRLGVEPVEVMEASNLEELCAVVKVLDANNEGCVITFENGLKVKIKGDEYSRLHRAIMHMTPLSFWEQWVFDSAEMPEGVSKVMLANLPEEYREDTDAMAKAINDSHLAIYNETKVLYDGLVAKIGKVDKKILAEEIKNNIPKNYINYVFGYKSSKDSGNWRGFWFGVHKKVRPTLNIIPGTNTKISNIRSKLEQDP